MPLGSHPYLRSSLRGPVHHTPTFARSSPITTAMSLQDYIADLQAAIAEEHGPRLQGLLSINPKKNKGPERANFNDPNDIDLFALPEKFHAVVRGYLKAMRLIYVLSDINELFQDLNALVVALNRAAENQSNWICPALINSSDELLSLYQVRAKSKRLASKSAELQGGSSAANTAMLNPREDEDALELVAATINKLFKICLTDKNMDAKTSKKACIHFFLAALIKIYFRLNKLELAKSMEKALLGTGLAVPTIINSPIEYRKYTVTYLYFSALLSLDESDFGLAKAKLLTAMEFLSCYQKPAKLRLHTEKILMLLVPLVYVDLHTVLPPLVYEQFPNLKFIYHDKLLRAVRQGDLHLFDESVEKFQRIFLSRHIYLLVVHLKNLCLLRVIQKAAAAYASIASESPHIMPYSTIQLALELLMQGGLHDGAATPQYSNTPEEIECIIANLIAKRWVKGYMSHANRCIVLSKTEPFPGPTGR